MAIDSVEFTVIGQPQSKLRARAKVINGRPIMYTPEQTVSYERRIREAYTKRYGDFSFGGKPVGITIEALYEMPKSKAKKIIKYGLRPTVKPDWDNVGKIVTDALNGVAYDDDKQITSAAVIKAYAIDGMPRIRVYLSEDD